MQTRRDQLHAYRFQNRRALAALVTGEPDVLEPPMRRLTVITLAGIMIAILVAVAYALVGVFKPTSGSAWKNPGAIIDVRGTGARYVLIDKVLRPVPNYTSAALIVGSQQGAGRPHIVLVDAGDLSGTPVGAPVGIAGLPDSLPSAARLIRSPWTVCSTQQEAATPQTTSTRVRLDVGTRHGARALPTDVGVLVRQASASGAGALFLLAEGRRYRVTSSSVLTALRIQAEPVPVGAALLDAVPAGPDLAPLTFSGIDQPSTVPVPDHGTPKVGSLLLTDDPGESYLMLPDGDARLDPVQVALAEAMEVTHPDLIRPITVNQTEITGVPHSTYWDADVVDRLAGLPQRVPATSSAPGAAGGVCAVYRGSLRTPQFAVPHATAPPFTPVSVTPSEASRAGQVDEVALPFDGAALVRSATSPTLFLVAAPGQKFAARSAAVVRALGYSPTKATVLPAQLIGVVPGDTALDPARAVR